MNCPECSSKNTLYMHEDPIPCTDCDTTIVVGYFMCSECNYSFRTTNGKFLDGTYPVEMGQVIKDLLDGMDLEDIARDIMDKDIGGGCDGCNRWGTAPMSDSICNCARCGQALILSSDLTEYSCPHCGFEWEILDGE
jgi:DNA-directed RNA polymerase subunit RPC12/RpoP